MRYAIHFLISFFLSLVHEDRKGSSMDAIQVVSKGDASLTLLRLRAKDEGTYICTVSVGRFHAQQVIQLRVIRKLHFCCHNPEDFHRISLKRSSVALFQNHHMFHFQRRSWFCRHIHLRH